MTYREWFNKNREYEREMLAEGMAQNKETLKKIRGGAHAYREYRDLRILPPYRLAWWEDVAILNVIAVVIALLLERYRPYMWGGYLVVLLIADVVLSNHLREDSMRLRKKSLTRCPKCRCEGCVVYARHGYEFDHAWVNSLFHVPGARYSAGIRHNYTDCLCKECGYRWTIPIDYRFLNK